MLLTLVVLAVVLPTIGFLWFVSKAMSNERAVMREKAEGFISTQLEAAQTGVAETLQNLSRAQGEPFRAENLSDNQRFHRITQQGLADSLIILDGAGVPAYPMLPSYTDSLDSSEADEKASSLLDQWHEVIFDNPAEAIAVLDEFVSAQAQSGRDLQGRLIHANLQLATLNRLDPNHVDYQTLHGQLAASLRDDQLPWPVTQKLFVLHRLESMGSPVKTIDSAPYQLAAAALEHPLQLGQPSILQRHPGSGDIWRVLTADRRYLLLFREATMAALLSDAAMKRIRDRQLDIEVAVGRQDNRVSLPIGPKAPLWHVSVHAQAAHISSNAAQKRAYTMALACILVAVVGVIGTFAIRRFLAQSRLTQLRTDFLSTISHELKTPLASTRMLVDTLVEGKVDDAERSRSYLEVIGRENARLSQLVENFLTYSRLESGRMPFDFRPTLPEEIANQAIDSLESKLHAEGTSFRAHIASNLPYIRADEATLAIALTNLLDNACKYTGPEKEVVLQVELRGSQAQFPVSDNGVGLTAADRERVLERFYRVADQHNASSSGSGLGLSIVNDIVTAHQGKLLIESLPGQGSVFTLCVPAMADR